MARRCEERRAWTRRRHRTSTPAAPAKPPDDMLPAPATWLDASLKRSRTSGACSLKRLVAEPPSAPGEAADADDADAAAAAASARAAATATATAFAVSA